MGFLCLTACAVVICSRGKNTGKSKKVNFIPHSSHYSKYFLKYNLFTTQRNSNVPQTDTSYYDEVEGAAGKVGCMTMKDNPSYSVPK